LNWYNCLEGCGREKEKISFFLSPSRILGVFGEKFSIFPQRHPLLSSYELVFVSGRKSRNFDKLDPSGQQKSGGNNPHRFFEKQLR
jgi:hypothetical protein